MSMPFSAWRRRRRRRKRRRRKRRRRRIRCAIHNKRERNEGIYRT